MVDIDAPTTGDELARFRQLQAEFARSFSAIFDDPALPRTVLIVPSLSLDQQVLTKIPGVHHYEERMLCLLLLLRMPRTRVIYVTSTAISETVIDYYLHLLPGVPEVHARRRLTLISCDDASQTPLTRKILDRPRILGRIRDAIPNLTSAHMTCFTVTELERKLALALGVPIYGCDPSLLYWGSKSGSRKIIRESGIDLPFGFEDLIDGDQVADALAELKGRKPELHRAVVKLNEGFSGEGNAIFNFAAAPAGASLLPWLRDSLPAMAFEARGMTWELYQDKLRTMGGSSRNSSQVWLRGPRQHSFASIPSAASMQSRRMIRYSAGRSFWAAVFLLTKPTGWTSKRAAPKSPKHLPAKASSVGSASISYRCKTLMLGAILRSRSTSGRVVPPIRFSCSSSLPTATTTPTRASF